MYCSFETRKVIECIEAYGLTVAESDYFSIEVAVGKFWNTHIQGVIEQVMRPTSSLTAEDKIERATERGWAYFDKPVWSMLTPRGQAHRNDVIDFEEEEHTVRIYNLIAKSFVLTDFNMRELGMLVLDIPSIVPDIATLSQHMAAAKRTSRTIYYLHGVAKRHHGQQLGLLKELRQNALDHEVPVFVPPEPLDFVEARVLADRWKQKQSDIDIQNGLNAQTP